MKSSKYFLILSLLYICNNIILKDSEEYPSIDIVESSKDLSVYKTKNAKLKITKVKNGGSRGEDEIVMYDSDNYSKTNEYGYEAQIKESFEVTQLDTNVKMLENGYILSGHSKGAKTIKENIEKEDYIIYINETKTAYVFSSRTDYRYAYHISKINYYLKFLNEKMTYDYLQEELYDKIYDLNKKYQTALDEDKGKLADIYSELKELYDKYYKPNEKIDVSKLSYSTYVKLEKIEYEKLEVNDETEVYADKVNKIGKLAQDFVKKYSLLLSNKVPLHYKELAIKINQLIRLYNSIDKELTTFDFKAYFSLKEVDYESLILQIKFLFIESHPVQVQAMWHTPGRLSDFDESKKEGIISLLKTVAECGFNRIYIETNSRGTSYYKSSILNSHKTYGKAYGDYRDYLECFIEEAHKLNIEVITWVQVLRVMNDDDDISKLASVYKKEWVSIDYKGKTSSFLDSTNDEVHKFLISQFTELVKTYKMDGLEYDYIRYRSGNIVRKYDKPSEITDFGYTENSIKLFKKQFGYSSDEDIKEILQDKSGVKNWIKFKKQRITDLLVSSKKELRLIRPDLILTAAVFREPNAIDEIMQDWPLWLDGEIVDYVEPMIYLADTEAFINEAVVNFLGCVLNEEEQYRRKKVIVGIGTVCKDGDYMEYFDQIGYVLSLYHSYSIFDLKDTLRFGKLVNTFKKYNYKPVSTTKSLSEKIEASTNDIINKIEGFYAENSDEDFSDLVKSLKNCRSEKTEESVNNAIKEIESIEDENIRENIYNIFIKVLN